MVGQLFVSYVYGSGPDQATSAQRAANIALYGQPTPAQIVRQWHLGGIILLDHNNLDPARSALSTGNVANVAQLRSLTAGLQQTAAADTHLPLLIGTDQEGGPVQRIPFVTSRPAEQALANLSIATLTCSYNHLGRELAALGVNQDYAPDADVNRATGGVIGDRSFGPNPTRDARDVVAAVAGLQSAGVLATLKHWPGHGSTSTDSHAALAVIHETAAQWRNIDLPPFAAAIRSAGAVMVGHLALPALDPTGRPATLSPVLTNHLLRGAAGYRGLIITDSLWMEPARAAGTPAAVALKALRAGNDMLLMEPDLPHAYRSLLAAIRTSPQTRALVQDAVRYILAAKAKLGRSTARSCS